jgi:hypothetical protein
LTGGKRSENSARNGEGQLESQPFVWNEDTIVMEHEDGTQVDFLSLMQDANGTYEQDNE